MTKTESCYLAQHVIYPHVWNCSDCYGKLQCPIYEKLQQRTLTGQQEAKQSIDK